jgi:hypothetical protein
VFEVFNHDEAQTVPSFTGIRKWLGRIGIYELKRENKQSGISSQSPSELSEYRVMFSDDSLQDFYQHVFDYVTIQSDKFKKKDIFLASSDVIESLFRKYKHFSSRCPLKEMGQMILTIYLSTMDLTTNLIKDALETISFVDVEDWLTEVFGRSTLSKRKILFSSDCYDTKTV